MSEYENLKKLLAIDFDKVICDQSEKPWKAGEPRKTLGEACADYILGGREGLPLMMQIVKEMGIDLNDLE